MKFGQLLKGFGHFRLWFGQILKIFGQLFKNFGQNRKIFGQFSKNFGHLDSLNIFLDNHNLKHHPIF
ncbi:hypothetical protein FZC76_01115 [Sutcliffiella horikoshii]|uniref:Uncharacterized protein n=1 Tax=Sutcliffiella horikoshii TaxID=79883 RepID=A0A5D4T8U0_9BACI|nr:hypothetical protein FZC76_01115 [Sutcliffiella horikoshii]